MSHHTRKRLNSLTDLLIEAYPDGMTTTEASSYLDVTRQTVHKDIQRLQEDNVPVYEPEPRRYAINPRDYIRPLQLTLPQAWMLYLPLRRMVRAQMHNHNVVNGLLQRLTVAFDPIIGEQLAPKQMGDRSFEADIFIQLVNAWRDHNLAAVAYQPLNKPSSRYLIAPYWFEPSVWSDSLYVIAGLYDRQGSPQSVTLKLDRIESITLRPQTFDPPSPQAVLESLVHSWGIWGGDEPTTVRLRFHNRQRQRLLETRWHPTEKISDEPGGSVLWEAVILEPQEMVPWIRGWGPDVEVLEPQSLREQIAMDADRAAGLYGRCDEDDSYF